MPFELMNSAVQFVIIIVPILAIGGVIGWFIAKILYKRKEEKIGLEVPKEVIEKMLKEEELQKKLKRIKKEVNNNGTGDTKSTIPTTSSGNSTSSTSPTSTRTTTTTDRRVEESPRGEPITEGIPNFRENQEDIRRRDTLQIPTDSGNRESDRSDEINRQESDRDWRNNEQENWRN